jgi:glycosyltransferase involved in cell wall biosynthesis
MSGKRKIAVLSHTFPPDSNGQALVLQRLLTGAEPGRVCLISGPDARETTLALPHFRLPPAPTIPNVKSLKLLVHPSQLALNIWWWSRHLKRVLAEEQCETLVACTGEVYELPAAQRAARDVGIPLVPYIFDWYCHKYRCLRGWHGRVIRSYARRIEGPVLRSSRAVIVPNETLRDAYRRQYRIDPVIVRNPTDFHPADIDDDASRGPCSDEVVICYTGAIYQAHYDAFANLMQAVGRLRSEVRIRVRLYTDADPAGLDALGVSGPVEVLSRVPLAEVPRIHQRADILFLPLAFRSPYPEIIRTSAPGKMGDYLASRRPILVHAPRDSFISWYFRTHDCGLVVDREDPVQLASALTRLVGDRQLRRRLAENAAARARMDFHVTEARKAFSRVVHGAPLGAVVRAANRTDHQVSDRRHRAA